MMQITDFTLTIVTHFIKYTHRGLHMPVFVILLSVSFSLSFSMFYMSMLKEKKIIFTKLSNHCLSSINFRSIDFSFSFSAAFMPQSNLKFLPLTGFIHSNFIFKKK